MIQDVQLDLNFFDGENDLREDIRKVLLRVVDDSLVGLAKKDEIVLPEFIVLTGSLTGPNWDEFSDVDLHIGVDFFQFDDSSLTRKYLALYASDFNHQHYELLNRDLELYFQDVTETHDSPGIYNIEDAHWMKVPDGIRIEVTKQMQKAASNYRVEVDILVAEYELSSKSQASSFLEKLLAYWQNIRSARSEGITTGGRESFGNQVFKQLRRNDVLKDLSDLVRQVRDDVYEVYRDGI